MVGRSASRRGTGSLMEGPLARDGCLQMGGRSDPRIVEIPARAHIGFVPTLVRFILDSGLRVEAGGAAPPWPRPHRLYEADRSIYIHQWVPNRKQTGRPRCARAPPVRVAGVASRRSVEMPSIPDTCGIGCGPDPGSDRGLRRQRSPPTSLGPSKISLRVAGDGLVVRHFPRPSGWGIWQSQHRREELHGRVE